MTALLDNWQSRLDQHFSQLHTQRGQRPLFALEHGLSQPDIELLQTAVRRHVATATPSRLHALAWIVYAAEIGYGYSGDEFWQTFEQKTPGWTARGDRGWLRERYQWFHKSYGGAAPSGPWADHFSIICWPITHAILPRDLQRQLARILYELRHSFSADLFESPATLGEFIAARSWNATSRFQNLAEETQLLGQIAAALLLQGECGTGDLLHPAALQRISTDLDRERKARGWLSSARHFAHERATVRGLSFMRGSAGQVIRRPEEAKAEIVALGIEPDVVLRPKTAERMAWEVFLELPDLSHLLLRFPKAREVIAESRCTVAGGSGRPLARGQCLYGSNRVLLARWPRLDEVLLQFERRDSQLDFLLRTECMLRPGPQWLFRIASDGLAYESRMLRVRPGGKYILMRAANASQLPSLPGLVSISVACEGVAAVMFTLPDALDVNWTKTLQALGLRQSRQIEVWPAGIAAAVWDGEGHGEWLASERPCLGLSTDHAIGSVVVSLDSASGQTLVLNDIVPGKPEFIELPRLAVGLHRLHFATRQDNGHAVESVGDLDVLMRIRESRPWAAGASPQGPLLVRIDPATPTLEQLWEGRAEIAIEGPTGRSVKCDASLIDSSSQARTAGKVLPTLTLPVDSGTWTRHFDRHYCGDKRVAGAYDTAKACELKFTADELGAFTLRCERAFTPLRWTVRRDGTGYIARLLNDSGDPTAPTLTLRTFERPCIEQSLAFVETFAVPTTGGMYVARRPNQIAAVIAPPVVEGLGDLGCTPTIDGDGRDPETLWAMYRSAELWRSAKLPGNVFSATRMRQVVSAIDRHAIEALCGHDWIRTEVAFVNQTTTLAYLQRAIWRKGYEAEVGVRLQRSYVGLSTAGMPERIREIVGIARFLIGEESSNHPSAEWLAEFVLRVTSDPAAVATWSGNAFSSGITALRQTPTLTRAARYLVLAIDRQLGSQTSGQELYAGWRWQ